MKNSFLFLFFVSLLLSFPAWAAEKIPVRNPPPSSPVEMTRRNIQDELTIQRNQRYESMPYLDKAIVRELISKKEIRDRIEFINIKGDKTLDDFILRALRAHTPAKVAWEKMSLSRRRILVAVRNLFPEAKFEIGGRHGTLGRDPFTSENFRFVFKQPIFKGGALWNTLLQEKAALEAQQSNYDVIIGNVIRDVSKAYFEYHRAKKVIEDQEKILQKLKPLADISQQKFAQEITSEIEHLHTQSLYGEMRYEQQTSKQELELARIELQKYANVDINDEIDVISLYDTNKFLNMEIKPDTDTNGKKLPRKDSELLKFAGEMRELNLEELIDMAYQHRPELRLEAAKLEAERFSEKVKWAGFMPQVDLTLEFGKLAEAFQFQSNNPSGHPEFRLMLESTWNIGGNKAKYSFERRKDAPTVSEFATAGGRMLDGNTLNVGLLDGLEDYVKTKDAQIAKLDQIVQLEKTEKEVIQEVKKAYFDYQKAQIQVQSTLQNVNYLRRSAELAGLKLEKNEIQIAEYMKAEIDLADGISKLHKALAEFLTARAAVNHSIGIPEYLKFGDKL